MARAGLNLPVTVGVYGYMYVHLYGHVCVCVNVSIDGIMDTFEPRTATLAEGFW